MSDLREDLADVAEEIDESVHNITDRGSGFRFLDIEGSKLANDVFSTAADYGLRVSGVVSFDKFNGPESYDVAGYRVWFTSMDDGEETPDDVDITLPPEATRAAARGEDVQFTHSVSQGTERATRHVNLSFGGDVSLIPETSASVLVGLLNEAESDKDKLALSRALEATGYTVEEDVTYRLDE